MRNPALKSAGWTALATLALGWACASKTALPDAISAGDAARVEALVGDEPNELSVEIDRGGELYQQKVTPLMYAALMGKPEVVKRLLGLGADPNLADSRGWTAFHFALTPFEQDLPAKREILRLLLARGADPWRKTKEGDTWPLILHPPGRRFDKALDDEKEAELVRFLAKSGVKMAPLPWTHPESHLNPKDLGDKSPLYWEQEASLPLLHWLARENRAATLRAYFDLGAPPETRDKHGRTVLAASITTYGHKTIRELLKAGADVRAKDSRGNDLRGAVRELWNRGPCTQGKSCKELHKNMEKIVSTLLDPSLDSREKLFAAFEKAAKEIEAQDDADLEARRRADAAARERWEKAERERAEAERRRAASRTTSGPKEPIDMSATAPACETPEMRACRKTGKSCHACFLESLGPGSAPPDEGPAPPGFVRCGGVLCGKGYVCCVGTTPSNRGQETCRLSGQGCQQGWFAERVK